MARIRIDHPVSIPAIKISPIGVRFVLFDSVRKLATIHPSDPVWSTFDVRCEAGTIVRVRPPSTASDADIERIESELFRLGAARVRIEPRAVGEKVVAPIVEPKRAARSSMREVVFTMAEEARTHNREALCAELERALSEVGV